MDLHANCFAAALLVLLLASRATDAAPHTPPAETEVPQPEGTAVSLNVEGEDAKAAGALSLCKMMPQLTPAEQRNCEVTLNVPNLGEKWEALTAQVMNQIRASSADEQGSKLPPFLERLTDPEVRKDLVQVALGTAGMTSTALMEADAAILRQLALVSLYLTAVFQLIKSDPHLASKLATDASEQANVTKQDEEARQKLA